MTVRRSRLEIYVDILKTVRSGVNKPTAILFRCNLAWKPFVGILGTLVNNSLIEVVDRGTRKTYKLTERGQEFLKQFESTEVFIATLRKPKKNRQHFGFVLKNIKNFVFLICSEGYYSKNEPRCKVANH